MYDTCKTEIAQRSQISSIFYSLRLDLLVSGIVCARSIHDDTSDVLRPNLNDDVSNFPLDVTSILDIDRVVNYLRKLDSLRRAET